MHPTHYKGILGELHFSLHLIQKGYTILNPVNNNSSYDIVAEKEGKFTRIQVKYCTPTKGGVLRIEISRPKRTKYGYKERGVDAMGVFDSINKKFYLVPIDKIKSKDEIWLRVSKPKNNQIQKIHFSNEFEI